MNEKLVQMVVGKLQKYRPVKLALPLSESVCVSIAEKGYERCNARLQNLGFAEIRLGQTGLRPPEILRIFSSGKKLIATSRTDKSLLAYAIVCHAPMMDIELDAPDRDHFIEMAKKQDCKVIVSHHDHEKTPSREELLEIKKQCLGAGADIVKIVCTARTDADCDNLLSLADPSTVAFGMGGLATFTRIASLIHGSPYTYASLASGKETAPGQLTNQQICEIVERLSL